MTDNGSLNKAVTKSRYGNYLYKYRMDASDEIIYIGKTTDIVGRIRQHKRGAGLDAKFMPYIDKCTVYVHPCSTENEMNHLESLLIDVYKPILNVVDKTETPTSVPEIGTGIQWEKYLESEYVKEKPKPLAGKKKSRQPFYYTDETIRRELNKAKTVWKTLHDYPAIGQDELFSICDYDTGYCSMGMPENDANWKFAEENLPCVILPYEDKNDPCLFYDGILTIKSEDGCERSFVRVDCNAVNRFKAEYEKIIKRYEQALSGEQPIVFHTGRRSLPVDTVFILNYDALLNFEG